MNPVDLYERFKCDDRGRFAAAATRIVVQSRWRGRKHERRARNDMVSDGEQTAIRNSSGSNSREGDEIVSNRQSV